MSNIKNILNFSVGMILGVIGSFIWQYDKFLYYSVFCVQAVILYILINYNKARTLENKMEGCERCGVMSRLKKRKGKYEFVCNKCKRQLDGNL